MSAPDPAREVFRQLSRDERRRIRLRKADYFFQRMREVVATADTPRLNDKPNEKGQR